MTHVPATHSTLSRLMRQVEDQVREHVLQTYKSYLERLLEALRDAVVGRDRYARGGPEDVSYYRYGYRKWKTVQVPWGTLTEVRVPRIRTSCGKEVRLVTYEHRLKALTEELLLGYVGGMSARTWTILLRELGIGEAHPQTLLRLIRRLREEKERWRKRPLSGVKALVLDGVWAKRRGSDQKKLVVLSAVGVKEDGTHELLDWIVAAREDRASYERLLTGLYERGLEEVELVVADEAEGIWQAVETVYPEAKKQICLWHLQRTLEQKLLQDMGERKGKNADLQKERRAFRAEYWKLFEAGGKEEAEGACEAFVKKWAPKAPRMTAALLWRKERLFSYLELPYAWKKKVRTSNLAENLVRHMRSFLRRYPGYMSLAHADEVVGLYVVGMQVIQEVGRRTPYQLQRNFNTPP
ncbi:MULE transposase, conserved domain-containing protein [Spirochaeta thermophila DSM 6578]|uniref:Mutator family transposase n=1 Tax=Winmispira thermophila (strain ATCC 700085 / DSM 6578 / Z-1203) TaxID=869211 RepID=G0GBM9_WINT7|nr:MULE transposase, conserved domain-containing protein [Spirochaeta thermophila DSM 6578]AEJ61107.1 MULE transposase, conserved domain-containing protein [Spirochaeta thermophila DSM 6578]